MAKRADVRIQQPRDASTLSGACDHMEPFCQCQPCAECGQDIVTDGITLCSSCSFKIAGCPYGTCDHLFCQCQPCAECGQDIVTNGITVCSSCSFKIAGCPFGTCDHLEALCRCQWQTKHQRSTLHTGAGKQANTCP